MDSLTSNRVDKVLRSLHEEADEADREYRADIMAQIAAAGDSLDRLIGEKIAEERANPRLAYEGHAEHFLAVSPSYGRLLYMCARASKARLIVEFGTSMGLSTIYLAAALRDNGGGRLIGSELEPAKVARARTHLEDAGFADLVEIREGNALETLRDIPGEIDLLLLDGAFSLYLPVLRLVENRLRAGAFVLAENAFDSEYLAYVRDPCNGYLSQPLAPDGGRGNEISVVTR